jgi:hypothetical protein
MSSIQKPSLDAYTKNDLGISPKSKKKSSTITPKLFKEKAFINPTDHRHEVSKYYTVTTPYYYADEDSCQAIATLENLDVLDGIYMYHFNHNEELRHVIQILKVLKRKIEDIYPKDLPMQPPTKEDLKTLNDCLLHLSIIFDLDLDFNSLLRLKDLTKEYLIYKKNEMNDFLTESSNDYSSIVNEHNLIMKKPKKTQKEKELSSSFDKYQPVMNETNSIYNELKLFYLTLDQNKLNYASTFNIIANS